MKYSFIFSVALLLFVSPLFPQSIEKVILPTEGLREPVEIITDQWGVPHIYAQHEDDLFFAQGWYAAKDRLFQFELWRRQATGTVAEILGMEELNRDIGTRLFKYRGDMTQELNMYHERGEHIIQHFVRGVNAYIANALKDTAALPIEFRLLGITPGLWTSDVVISRHQGLLGNIGDELDNALALRHTDTTTLAALNWFHPKTPILSIDSSIRLDLLHEDILFLYNVYRRPVLFKPEYIVAEHRSELPLPEGWAANQSEDYDKWVKTHKDNIGSNNWVINGDRTESGYPIMANDPHRGLSTPSLRYMAHLHAPGWDVIGAGEPTIPGISIGHNQYGAWGLTVYSTDAEDLYIYDINPENPRQYRYGDQWESMRSIADTILVKDVGDMFVTHYYTRHGPVTYIDSTHHVAYAIRCGWLEPGGAPYLASLRMNQSRNWDEFRLACRNSNIPGENMIWGDREGNIGWQAVGIAPIRQHWSGLVPVPGDGRYEWDGYLPNMQKPHSHNPSSGMINTSNENVTPPDYAYWNAIGYSWSDPYRGDRVRELLNSGKSHSITDMMKLQTDYLSIPARQILPLFQHLSIGDARVESIRKRLLDWDFEMRPESIEAGIYNMLETVLREKIRAFITPQELNSLVQVQIHRLIQWLYSPPVQWFGTDLKSRDLWLIDALAETDQRLRKKLGDNMQQWQYGQPSYKHAQMYHPLSRAVGRSLQNKLNVGPLPRGGYSNTVNNTSNNDNQRSGATFRIIVDTGDWDRTMAMNSPGQNGNPDHPHYSNLFALWAKDQFFPLYYSREKVEQAAFARWLLTPIK